MKTAFSCFLLLTLACSTRQTEKGNSLNAIAAHYRPSPGPDQKEKYLTIHGKDIWVRDEPATGKVVMKLNEGNRCKIKIIGRYEIIRNTGDFWYSIEFNGKGGWVFGSQTDQKLNPAKLDAATADGLWKIFKTTKIDECRKLNVKSDEAECIIDQGMMEKIHNTDESKLQLMHAHMNPLYYEYRYVKFAPQTMILIAETQSLEGAGGWSTTDHFYAGFSESERYSLAVPGPNRGRFDGRIDTIVQINQAELIVFATQDERGVAYHSEKYFNIYRIDLTGRSIQTANSTLGRSEAGYSLENETEEGGIRVKSSRYEILLNKAALSFRLLEYKMKKKAQGFEDIPNPDITTYTWDKVQKKFAKQ